MVALSVLLGAILGGVLLLWVLHSSSGWSRTSKSGARLPNGSMGWPIIGESLAFARDPSYYALSRIRRYGGVFKSSLFTKPAVIGTTPDFAKFVIANSAMFKSGYPANVREIVGPRAFAFKDGVAHLTVKKLLLRGVLPESLKQRVGPLDTIILQTLDSWAQKGTFVVLEETRKVTLDVGMFLVLGIKDMRATAEGREMLRNFVVLSHALTSLPVNIPGTTFHKGKKAKTALTVYLKELMKKRRLEENFAETVDTLGILLASKEDPQMRAEVKDMDDDEIADTLVMMLFAAYDTTSTTLVWILKLLLDHEDVFRNIQAEHEEIFQSKKLSKEPVLTLEDTRKMVYSAKFFCELQRLVSVAISVFREAKEDMEYNGRLIPKHWTVTMMLDAIHSDPESFPDPYKFDPSRFDNTPKPFTYLPFSSGPHMCPGMEFAKMVSLVFIHHLVTKFKFDSTTANQGIVYNSFRVPKGFSMNIQRIRK